MPALLRLHHAKALLPRPVEVVGGVAGSPHADLNHPAGIQKPVFNGPSKRGAVGDLGAEHGVVNVGVGVHVHEAYRAVLLCHGSKDREHDGVVASYRRSDQVVG